MIIRLLYLSNDISIHHQTILKPSGDATSLSGSFFQYSDPRIQNLVDRVLIDRSGLFISFQFFLAHSPKVSENQFDKVTSLAEYEVFRFLNGLSESEELEGHIPLEYNLDLLHYISFTKGCYIGQELTARTKYRVGFLCPTSLMLLGYC